MKHEDKFALVDKIKQLSSAINCLSLDPESINNSIIKSKIDDLLEQITSNVYEIEEVVQANKENIKIKSTDNTNKDDLLKEENNDNNNTSEKDIISTVKRVKHFVDGSTTIILKIISFGNKYAVTSHEGGEVNLWDIESYLHIDKNSTCHKSSIYSIVSINDKALKFATCCFGKESKLSLWSINNKKKLCLENFFKLNYRVRLIKHLNINELANYDNKDSESVKDYLLLSRMDNLLEIWQLNVDFNFTNANLLFTIETNYVLTQINFIIKKSSTNENKENFECYVVSGSKDGELSHLYFNDKQNILDNYLNYKSTTPDSNAKKDTFIFNYDSLINEQIEAIQPLEQGTDMFLVGSLENTLSLFKLHEKNKIKTIYTFPNVVTTIWYSMKDNSIAVGSDYIYLFNIQKKEDNLDFVLTEKIHSGFIVDDFVVKYENNLKESSFIWILMESRLLRIISPN